MENYFYDDDAKERIKESLLTEKAKQWAKGFITPSDGAQKNPKLTSTQLRKFHIEAKALEELVKNLTTPETDFPRIRPMVKMLKSKVAYVCPPIGKDRKVPTEFRAYIEDMVDHIEDWKDFMAFALCFEAVVGYFYGEGGR